tara:strand:+ start:6654 stop:7193 length:540 start_codon:yes stop_codon:yes gene_type:complete
MGESTERIVDGNGLRIAIVYSEYNGSIVSELLTGAKEGLEKCNVLDKDILCASVPGAFEIPLIIKRLCRDSVSVQDPGNIDIDDLIDKFDGKISANPNKINAIIALGCIIRGETSHYDLICNEVTRAILDISLNFDIPILHGILTTENLEQAKERSGDGMNNKGYECALSAVQMGIISS